MNLRRDSGNYEGLWQIIMTRIFMNYVQMLSLVNKMKLDWPAAI